MPNVSSEQATSKKVTVRISVASMRQRFHGCDPEFIQDVCHARCCDAPSRPSGTLITIHRSEQAAIEARGGVVTDGFLESPDRVCPFKDDHHLCTLHTTPDKPFGCIASPFTLNGSDCLVVRNRYRMLPCYSSAVMWKRAHASAKERAGWPPAYEAFRASLDLIFGAENVDGIVRRIEGASEARFLEVTMPRRSYEILKDNDHAKVTVKEKA